MCVVEVIDIAPCDGCIGVGSSLRVLKNVKQLANYVTWLNVRIRIRVSL